MHMPGRTVMRIVIVVHATKTSWQIGKQIFHKPGETMHDTDPHGGVKTVIPSSASGANGEDLRQRSIHGT